MANEHPFHLLFESLGRLPVAHADAVNREAYEALAETLDVPVEGAGRCILLRAPRAGYGKTHLLSRIQHQLGGSHEFIPLHALGSRIDASSVIEDILKRVVRSLPAAGGLTVLDLIVRRLFSFALQPLVISGEVPCQDREGALVALKNRPVETFDFHHPNAVTAHWAKENFEILGPRLSLELAQRTGAPIREVGFWVNALFRFASTPLENPSRSGVLGLEVAGEPTSENLAMERLVALLAMLSLLTRVVLVADDLEGFSADETAALRLAAFVGTIRQAADRMDVILSLNQDVWENAFLPRLSGGLADRLSEVVVELKPLTEDEMVALYESRVPGLGIQIASRVKSAETHARGLIRAAGLVWQKEEAELTKPAAEPVPAAEPAPVAEPAAEDLGIFGGITAATPPPASEVFPQEPVVEQASEAAAEDMSAPAAESGPLTEPDFPAKSWETPNVQEPVQAAQPSQPVPQWEPVQQWQPVASWEAVPPEPTPAAPAPAVPQYEAAPPQYAPPQYAPPQVETPEGYEPAVLIEPGPQWGRSVFEAVVTDQPVSRPFSEPSFSAPPVSPPAAPQFAAAPEPAAQPPAPVSEFAASGFPQVTEPTPPAAPQFSAAPEPVAQPAAAPASGFFTPVTEPTPPAFSAAPESSQPAGWQFQAVHEEPAPAAAAAPATPFGPPAFSAPAELKQPSDDEAQRVDDLLRQFRERYGRGSL